MSPHLPASLAATPAFTPDDAARAGLTPDAVARLARSGDVVRVQRGWYRAPGDLDDAAQHTVRAWVGHRVTGAPLTALSALVLHGLPTFDLTDRPVTLLAVDGVARTRPGMRLVVGPPGTPTDGLCTDVATSIALAALTDPEAGLVAADAAVRRRGCTVADIARVLDRCGRRRGTAGARTAVGLVDPRRESAAESRTGWLLAVWGLAVEPQHAIDLGDRTVYADFRITGTRVLVEVDGALKYDSPQALYREKRREDEMRRLGWTVVRVVWADLYRPDALRRRIMGALAA